MQSRHHFLTTISFNASPNLCYRTPHTPTYKFEKLLKTCYVLKLIVTHHKKNFSTTNQPMLSCVETIFEWKIAIMLSRVVHPLRNVHSNSNGAVMAR